MLELLALAPADGWAFVRSDGRIRLVRPPYDQTTSSTVTERVVETAVLKHGFNRLGETKHFDSWQELIGFLNGTIREERSPEGLEVGIGGRMLEYAPLDVLSGFLDRVERELLPSHKWEAAQSVLTAMLELPRVRQDETLWTRATDLVIAAIQGAAGARQLLRTLPCDIADFDSHFPRTSHRYGRDRVVSFAAVIAERRGIFAFAQ